MPRGAKIKEFLYDKGESKNKILQEDKQKIVQITEYKHYLTLNIISFFLSNLYINFFGSTHQLA